MSRNNFFKPTHRYLFFFFSVMLKTQAQNLFVNTSWIFSRCARCLTNWDWSHCSIKSQCRKPEICRIQAINCTWWGRKTLQHPTPKNSHSASPQFNTWCPNLCCVGHSLYAKKWRNLLPSSILALKRKPEVWFPCVRLSQWSEAS